MRLQKLLAERLPALRHRDFRNLWIGQIISAAGSQMQVAALHWQIYSLTQSPVALGAVGLVRIIPIILFSLIGGVAADTYDRRRVLLITQSVLTAVALVLGVWSMVGKTTLPVLYICTAIGAAAIAFDNPARQSLVPSLVPQEDQPNAFAINSTGFQVATIAGPVLAGLIIARLGTGWAYLLNALSFLAVLFALATMQFRPESTVTHDKPAGFSFDSLREGIAFVRRTPILIAAMTLDFWATFFSSATALLPIFARDILKVGAEGFGWLSAFPAIGSLVAGITLSLLPPIQQQGKYLLAAVILYGVATIGFGFCQSFWLAAFFLAMTGATDTVSTILRNIIRQTVTPDSLRGRMVSINMLFFMGGPQLGELEAGIIAKLYGAPVSVVSGGLACILIVLLLPLRWRWLPNFSTSNENQAVK